MATTRRSRSKSSSRSKGPSRSRNSPKVTEAVHIEFGGTPGAIGVMLGLPLVIYLLYFVCNDDICMTYDMSSFAWSKLIDNVKQSAFNLLSTEAWLMYFVWMGMQLVMAVLLPGEIAQGVPIAGAKSSAGGEVRLKYPLSGHLQFWVSMLLMGHGMPSLDPNNAIKGLGRFPLEMIYDHYLQLITVSILGATLLSFYLYFSSFIRTGGKDKILARGGNTGYRIYDFFIGRELNPRIGASFDLKYICELRPGLIGWVVINMGMATKQFLKRKALYGSGSITTSMLAVNLMQGLYVWDALYQERAILSTMDITTDGFGFMLAFGDLAWVPFIYSLQARYLVDYDPNLSPLSITAITIVHFAGYAIFRLANSEKDKFRRNPDECTHLTYLNTKRGTKLITSGWWGAARKINYTGDWLVTFSWCLLCGFSSPIPYFQAVYFAILLVHRAIRDDMMCQEKYGDDWARYKEQVPYVFIPYVI